MRAHAYSGHHFMKKSKSALRVLKSLTMVDKTNIKAVKRLIPHSL
jgi:ribosomal protein L35